MSSIQDLFKLGMDRDLPPLRSGIGESLELGAGNDSKKIQTDHKLGRPEWDAERDPRMPFSDGQFGLIHAYHFFEHLTGDAAMRTLMECQRVLAPHGVLNIVVPYYNSNLQHQSLDHRSTWNEGTWQVLFNDAYFDDIKRGWRFSVHICFIMGVVERNLALFTQLVRLP